MTAGGARQDLTARGAASLALLGLPISALLSLGIGVGFMALAGCSHLSPSWATVGASLVVVSAGAMISSLAGNLWRARRARCLAEQASIAIDDPERLSILQRLADQLGTPTPELRAIPLDSPLAFGVLGARPSLVVSTWVFEQLTEAEWEALVAHEIAHMRRDDQAMRWLGSGLFEALKGLPGTRGAWDRLETAMEAAADHAVVTTLGSEQALVSARRKFLDAEGKDDGGWHQVIARPTRSYQLALACLGMVAALPLLPFVVVPLCVSLCGV